MDYPPLRPQDIVPGKRYLVRSLYGDYFIVVTVVEPSKNVLDHWACTKSDGARTLVPLESFVREVPDAE